MLAVIVGLIFVILGIWGVIAWWPLFLIVIKGFIPVMIACGGLLSVIAGATSIRDIMEGRTTKEIGKKEE